MTQDGGMLSTKQEEDLCGCCADVPAPWVWIWAKAKWPDYYWWLHVKDIKATLLHSETVARYAPPGELLYLLDTSH